MVQKVKAKKLGTSNWVYGQLIQTHYGQYIAPLNISEMVDHTTNYILVDDMEEIYTDTICRFIGKQDSKGKDIYEFDVIHENGCFVAWSDELLCWCFQHRGQDDKTPLFHNSEPITLQGYNIHD